MIDDDNIKKERKKNLNLSFGRDYTTVLLDEKGIGDKMNDE